MGSIEWDCAGKTALFFGGILLWPIGLGYGIATENRALLLLLIASLILGGIGVLAVNFYRICAREKRIKNHD